MKFLYRGIINDNQYTKGSLEANDQKQALAILAKNNIQVHVLNEARKINWSWIYFWKPRRKNIQFQLEEACLFFEKLFSLLRGGLTLADAIESIINNTSNVHEKELLENVLQELREGTSLSKALNKFCNSFANNVLCILDVGDVTGNLVHAVSNVIKILRRKIELKKHIIAGLSYPLLICSISLGVIALFMFYLVPKVESMMQNLGGRLPMSTSFLMKCSHFLFHHLWIFLISTFFVIIVLYIFYQSPKNRLWLDRNFLKCPLIGPLRMLYLRVNITNIFAGLLSSGIDVSRAMIMSMDTISNSFLKQQYLYAQEAIMAGASVAHTLQNFLIIDGTARDVLAVGEKTGDLGGAFANVAAMYENQLDGSLKKLVTYTSTIALLFAFLLVAVLALSIVSSVLNFSVELSH